MREEPVDAEDLQKLETRLEKKFREEAESIMDRIKTDHARWEKAREELSAKWTSIVGNHRDLSKELTNAMAELSVKQRQEIEAMEKADEANRRATMKEITGTEQAIKRFEREIELLNKEVAALKKEALTGADLKPLVDRIKKLESGK